MSLKLWLSVRTPYAMQPSSIEFMLLVCNLGAEPVRGPEPDGMDLETLDERGERLPYVPCGPSPFGPREIEVPAGGFHSLIKIGSRASGTRDDGLYQARCHWQGATSNLLKYRVIGDRRAYVATMRPVPGKPAIEVTLTNGGSTAIEWPQPCSEQDIALWGANGERLEAEMTSDAEALTIAPGEQAVLRFAAPDAPRGVPITGHFVREPFVSGAVTLML